MKVTATTTPTKLSDLLSKQQIQILSENKISQDYFTIVFRNKSDDEVEINNDESTIGNSTYLKKDESFVKRIISLEKVFLVSAGNSDVTVDSV